MLRSSINASRALALYTHLRVGIDEKIVWEISVGSVRLPGGLETCFRRTAYSGWVGGIFIFEERKERYVRD